MKLKLLSPDFTNAKLAKNSNHSNIRSFILYLAPATVADGVTNLCPASTEGCRKACLFSAGRGAFKNVFEARKRKALQFINNRKQFLNDLIDDLRAVERKYPNAAVRLNGTSDIDWENMLAMESFNLQFYDYTKRPERAILFSQGRMPKNYHLTFSLSESNGKIAGRFNGINVAAVFKNSLPEQYMGRPVIDGTAHDLRFLDPKGIIVGLVAKGKAKTDDTNFAINWQAK